MQSIFFFLKKKNLKIAGKYVPKPLQQSASPYFFYKFFFLLLNKNRWRENIVFVSTDLILKPLKFDLHIFFYYFKKTKVSVFFLYFCYFLNLYINSSSFTLRFLKL